MSDVRNDNNDIFMVPSSEEIVMTEFPIPNGVACMSNVDGTRFKLLFIAPYSIAVCIASIIME